VPKELVQVTLIQIDNYGPWTLDLGPEREAYLQILQSELYVDLQRLFSAKHGLVFYSRFDNMLAITNGVSLDDHKEIQEKICNRYPVTVSFGVGLSATALDAQREATRILQQHGSSQSQERRKILAAQYPELIKEPGFVQIAHIDVNDTTSGLTDTVSAYDALLTMLNVQRTLADEFRKRNGLVFFNGGDNFVAISNGLTKRDYETILETVGELTGLTFKAGVGRAHSATEALKLASTSLDEIRKKDAKGPVHMKST